MEDWINFIKAGKFPWLGLIQKCIKFSSDWSDSWKKSQEYEKSNNSESIDKADEFCATKEFDDSFKSSDQGNLLRGIDKKLLEYKSVLVFESMYTKSLYNM